MIYLDSICLRLRPELIKMFFEGKKIAFTLRHPNRIRIYKYPSCHAHIIHGINNGIEFL